MKSILRLLSFLIIGIVCSTSSTAQTIPDIEAFFPSEKYGKPALSPTGKLLAMPDYSGEHHKVIIVDLTTKKTIYTHPMGDLRVNWVQWATEDRILLSLTFGHAQRLSSQWFTRDENGNITRDVTIRYSRIIAMNIDASEQTIMFKNTNNKVKKNFSLSRVTDILPNDPDHILMPAKASKYTLWKVNIHTGDAVSIEKGSSKTTAWKTNQDGVPVVRFDRIGWGSSAYVKVFVRAPGKKKWEKVATVRQKDLKKFNPIAQSENPAIYYVSARPKGYDRASIFKYDLQSKQILEQVSSNTRVDLFNALVDDGGNYYGSVYYEDRLEYDFLDKKIDSHMKRLDAFFEEENNILINDISANGRVWLLHVSGPREPGGYYTYNTETQKTEKFISRNTSLKKSDLGKIEIINYESRDGQKLRGYLTKPAHPKQNPAPLLVMPHGGPHSRDYYEYDRTVQFYVSRGYQVFQTNFRGSTGFGDKFEHAGYKKWDGIMIDDITDGVLHLINNGKVDKDHICIVGASYGGYAAYIGAVKTPNLYKCAVSISGVSDIINTIKFDLKRFKDAKEIKDFILQSIGNPKKDKDMLIAQSPITHAGEIKIPVLIIHGDADEVVPVEQSRAMHAALLQGGGKSKFIEYSGADHSLFGLDVSNKSADDYYFTHKQSMKAVETFLSEHLKP